MRDSWSSEARSSAYTYHYLSCRSPRLGVRECVTHLFEPKDLIHQRFDGAAFHQPRDCSQLFSIGPHEKVLIPSVVLARGGQRFSGQYCDRENDDGVEPPTSCKRWGRGATVDAHHHAAGFHTLETPHQRFTACAVQHHVTILGHVFKARATIVNRHVRAQTRHQLHVALAHRGEDRCA